MVPSRRRFLIAGALAAVGAAAPARASLVIALDLPAMTARSQRIVVGEVLSARSAWDARRERILTTIELQVAEVWKGDVPGSGRLTIVQPGGVADGIEMKVHGLPTFRAGERAVLFLRGDGAGPLALVGMGQGKRPLRFDAASARWMVEGGDRSAAVVLGPQGRTEPAGPEPALPLDELRRRVRALIKK